MLALAQPIVVYRGGEPEELLAGLEGSLSTEAMARLRAGLLHLPPVEASSTDLRGSLGESRVAGPSLPPTVHDYIVTHGLYAPLGEQP